MAINNKSNDKKLIALLPLFLHLPGASAIWSLCTQVSPSSHSPAEYVGGQKQEPHDSPSFLAANIFIKHHHYQFVYDLKK